MQIVIDIPEDNYYDALQYVELPVNTEFENLMISAIKNGTPLPKGHGRLIEVSKDLECELWTYTRYTGIDEAPYEDATNALELAPTIIEADRAEGSDKE